jgi:hypothetical protein
MKDFDTIPTYLDAIKAIFKNWVQYDIPGSMVYVHIKFFIPETIFHPRNNFSFQRTIVHTRKQFFVPDNNFTYPITFFSCPV